MKKSLLFFALFFPFVAYSQGVTIGANNPPDPSSVLDIQSNTGGLLYPRLTTAQRNAISNPAVGLQIYNTTTHCFQAYFPGGWKDIECDCQSAPSSAFTYPNQISINNSAAFTATVPGLTYTWTFPSGSPSSGSNQTESVTWSALGTYAVSLTVTDNQGCSSTTTHNVTVVNCPPPLSQSVTFNFTGAMQTWVVPACATTVSFDIKGAQGSNGNGGIPGQGGMGGQSSGTLAVTPGETLYIYVGGQNGWNGGGTGTTNAGNGGGASDIRRGGTTLTDRVIVAGGGGGGGGDTYNNPNAFGGNGGTGGGTGNAGTGGTNTCCGGTAGSAAWPNGGGEPGQSHNCWTVFGGRCGGGGGAGGNNAGGSPSVSGSVNGTSGALGVGGNGAVHITYGNGGGGGAGWYGGAGGGSEGNGGGGGGGSSYIGGVSGGTTTSGVRSGDGEIIINY